MTSARPRHPTLDTGVQAPDSLPDFPESARKHRPLVRLEPSSPEAGPGVSQSCPHVPQRLSHEWVNQSHLEPMYVFPASASILTHTRCVRQPLKCLNPRFQHSLRVVFLTGRSSVPFWGLHSCSSHPLQENWQQGRTKYLLVFATLSKSLLGWAAGAGSRTPSSVTCGSVKPRSYLG